MTGSAVHERITKGITQGNHTGATEVLPPNGVYERPVTYLFVDRLI